MLISRMTRGDNMISYIRVKTRVGFFRRLEIVSRRDEDWYRIMVNIYQNNFVAFCGRENNFMVDFIQRCTARISLKNVCLLSWGFRTRNFLTRFFSFFGSFVH